MNININQGQHYSNDSVLTAIIAISIFALGILIRILIKYISERKRLNNVKKFLKFGLDRLIVSAKPQIDILNKTSSEIGNIKHYHFALNDNVDFNNKSLSSISVLDLYKIIFKLKTNLNHSEILDVILNTLDFIPNHRKNYIKNFHLFFTKYSDYEKQWNEKFDELRKRVEVEINNNVVASPSKLNIELNSIYSYYRKNAPDDDMDTKKELFIDKIIEACETNITDPIAKNIGQSAVHCSNIFKSIIEHRKIYSDQMLNEEETLKNELSRLRKSFRYFNT